ncbi:KAP family P-loop NTPase fold protein [Marinomonas shanghaiensis]|uniref:KAP family P-loop NTPase fold protein n=1 Tax=Marinomonas shanghaiensis TaxID=2202418 RepID=UPI000DB93967|nr:P-loop NTPase fold protein [Marinomonas shanghaiensis]
MSTEQTIQPFEYCASNGKRKQLAERFTAYLNTRDTEKHAFVANLNGGWGTGKTYFVEEWQKLLRKQDYIAIKIDAWESDYLNDPLSILVAEILEQIYEQDSREDFTEAEKKLTRGVISLGKAIAPSIIKGALATWVWGEETNKELKAIFDSAADSLNDISTNKAITSHGAFADEAFGKHKLHKSFAKQFKKELQKLLGLVNNSKDEPKEKTYIFVDELDRCRPTYAIEMLETVKHLFDIPNVIFVLSTDTEQLEHSIKAVYGQDFNSREYLSRFFNQRMVLPEPDLLEFIKAEKAFEIKDYDFSKLKTFPQISQADQLQDAFCIFCELNKHNLSLRTIKHLIDITEGLLTDPEVLKYQFCIYLLLAAIFGENLYIGTIYDGEQDKLADSRAILYSYKVPSNSSKYAREISQATKNQKMSDFLAQTINHFHIFQKESSVAEQITGWPIFKGSRADRNPRILNIFISESDCHNQFNAIRRNLNAGDKSICTPDEMIGLVRRTSTYFEKS